MRNKKATAKQLAAQPQPGEAEKKGGGLVLDDVLAVIHAMRKTYDLPEATFGLEQIEQEPKAKAATVELISTTLLRHGKGIHSKPDPVLDKICDIRRGKRVEKPWLYSGWQIPPAHASRVLRALLEKALQTVVQLPKKDLPLSDGTRKLKQLALHCDKLAKEIDDAFRTSEVRDRATVYFRANPGPGLKQFSSHVEALQRAAETFRSILAKTRLVKQRTDSPNPQVRFALYLVGWFEACTGRKQYAPFKTLLNAAYGANGMETPPWVNRLEI